MGSGKTTLGQRAAERLSLPFFDVDERIERESGMSVSEIFSREGEAEFRRREREALSRLVAEEEQGVIATGGGAFTTEENRKLMSEAGIVVWLDVPAEEILDRISESGSRPLWKGPDEVRRLHEERRASYRRAHHRLALSNANPEEGVERLCRLLHEYQKDP